MDPVTTLALAGNIFQFIDTGAKLAGITSGNHDSLTEQTRITLSLEDVLGTLALSPGSQTDEQQSNGLVDLAG